MRRAIVVLLMTFLAACGSPATIQQPAAVQPTTPVETIECAAQLREARPAIDTVLMTWLMSRLETVPPRVRTALGRDLTRIIAGEGGALAGLDSAGLVAELRRPGGGRVGKVRGLGAAGLVVLREALRPGDERV